MENTRKLWHITLAVIASSLMMTACYSQKKAVEKDVVKTKADTLKEVFNINADSCLYYYAPKISQIVVGHAWDILPENATKEDSVKALLNRTERVPKEYTIGYDAHNGVIRTGRNAMLALNQARQIQK